MDNCRRIVRIIVAGLMVLSQMADLLVAQAVGSEETDCVFDAEAPTVISARASFRAADYACAEKELNALLAEERLGRGTQANAHMLLAAVYFESTEDPSLRRQKVRAQFVQGLQADPKWVGPLELTDPAFLSIYNDAREMMNYINRTSPEVTEPHLDTILTSAPPAEAVHKGKPWYRRWWALGSGVGIVALGAVLILGGGSSSGGNGPAEPDTLPEFPPPP